LAGSSSELIPWRLKRVLDIVNLETFAKTRNFLVLKVIKKKLVADRG
jgi:hypothetical protein